MSTPDHIELYTDGAASGNPGPGGFGVVLKYKGKRKEISDGFKKTTNNRMELLAVIVGLESVKNKDLIVKIHSDAVNFLLGLAHNLSGFLLVLNILSLIMTVVVMFTSWGMTKPVHESVHWLAWVAAFPSGACAISAAITVALFIAIIVVAIIIWVIVITLVLTALSVAMSSS